MIFKIEFPAPINTVYAKGSFENVVGTVVPFRFGNSQLAGLIKNAEIINEGSSVVLDVDLDGSQVMVLLPTDSVTTIHNPVEGGLETGE